MPPVRATTGSGGVISQSRLGSTRAEAATVAPARKSRLPTSLRHSSQICSSAVARLGANWSPTAELRLLPSAMPISSTVTPRPSLRPRASAMTAGACPRGCCPRSQRATDVLSYRRSSPCSAPQRLTRRARPALEQPASWISCCRRSFGSRATSGLAAMGFFRLPNAVRTRPEGDDCATPCGIPTVTYPLPTRPGECPCAPPLRPLPPLLGRGVPTRITVPGDNARPVRIVRRRPVTPTHGP